MGDQAWTHVLPPRHAKASLRRRGRQQGEEISYPSGSPRSAMPGQGGDEGCGSGRRGPRSWGTGRRTRRRGRAARRARRRRRRARRGIARGGSPARHRACRSARRRPCPPASPRSPRSPRRSDRPWRCAGRTARGWRCRPAFGLPPRIQKMSRVEGRQRGGGAVGVGGLAVVDEEDAPRPADLLQAMRQARERRRARPPPRPATTPRMSAAALAASAFWMLWRPRSEPMPARSAKAPSGPVQGARATSSVPTAYQPWRTRSRADTMIDPAAVGEPQALGDVAAPVVVLADDDALRGLDQARLQRRIVLHGAVAVEVVGRDVEQHADAGRQRRRQLDLERRHLDHVDAVCGRRLQVQDGGADVAAHLHVASRRAQDVGDERRGRRLAVGAGDGDERRIGAARAPARGRTARRRR